MQGLLHDATEAYLQDLSRPLKLAMRAFCHPYSPYDIIEMNLDRVIAEHFGLERPLPFDVKIADTRMLATEAAELGFLDKAPHPWDLPDRYPEKISPLPFGEAYDMFMYRYYELPAPIKTTT
jgi:hypothetical protein